MKPRLPHSTMVRKCSVGNKGAKGVGARAPGSARVGPRLPLRNPDLGGPGLGVDRFKRDREPPVLSSIEEVSRNTPVARPCGGYAERALFRLEERGRGVFELADIAEHRHAEEIMRSGRNMQAPFGGTPKSTPVKELGLGFTPGVVAFPRADHKIKIKTVIAELRPIPSWKALQEIEAPGVDRSGV